MERIAFFNQAGGVGKTTCLTHVAHALALKGKSVVVADCDPQANATTFLGASTSLTDTYRTLYDAVVGKPQWEVPMANTEIDRLYLIPGSNQLAGVGVLLGTIGETPETFVDGFSEMLEKLEGGYDYLLLDCPPTQEIMTYAALSVADGVICPVALEAKGVLGTRALIEAMATIGGRLERDIKILGFVPSRYDRFSTVHRQCLKAMQLELAGVAPVTNPIKDSYRILSAQARSKTLFQTNPADHNIGVFNEIADLLMRA